MKKIKIYQCFLILTLLFITPYSFSQQPPPYHGMVVSENMLASQIGVDILKAGGNAIDAAVAVGYALAVVNPCCGNIGGGGFMTIHLANDKNIVINFREKASLNASKDMFLDKQGRPSADKSLHGYLAVAVPGTVLGLDTALQKYGTMTRAQVMAPAIKLAEDGFIVTPFFANQLQEVKHIFKSQKNVVAIFFKNGTPYQSGDLLKQKDLANTLRLIATQGPNVFYRGSIAETIVKASNENGGILTAKDFADYTVEELSPIYCDYRGFQLILPPPPSSGGITLCEMLNILENFPLQQLGYRSPQSIYYILETMRYGFLDRNLTLGDPHFTNNPVSQLTSKTYAKSISKKILNHASLSNSTQMAEEKINTTHYSIIDKQGNAVSVTYTLNRLFGAGVIAGNTGFFLNNEMDDFAVTGGGPNSVGLVQSNANAIASGKRPLSSTTPTIVLKNGKLFLIIGSPGGPRIITSVLLSLLNIIDYHFSLKQAIDAPRFHYQAQPDWIDKEPFAFSTMTEKKLEMMGYHFSIPSLWGAGVPIVWGSGVPGFWGAVEAIQIDENGKVSGVNDNRRPDGAAISE